MPFLSAKEEGGALSQHQPLPSSNLPTLRKTSRIPFLSLVARHPTFTGLWREDGRDRPVPSTCPVFCHSFTWSGVKPLYRQVVGLRGKYLIFFSEC